jgi:hypothetical protein
MFKSGAMEKSAFVFGLALAGAAGDRRGSAANIQIKIDERTLFVKSTSTVDCSFVGAGLAAKLLFAPITLVDKRTLVVKSTSVVDLFVPKGTPTRGRCGTCRSCR